MHKLTIPELKGILILEVIHNLFFDDGKICKRANFNAANLVVLHLSVRTTLANVKTDNT